MIDKYINFDYLFDNSIDVNIDEIILNEFGFKSDEFKQCIDIDEIYKNNYKELFFNNNKFNDFISDNKHIKSLILF